MSSGSSLNSLLDLTIFNQHGQIVIFGIFQKKKANTPNIKILRNSILSKFGVYSELWYDTLVPRTRGCYVTLA